MIFVKNTNKENNNLYWIKKIESKYFDKNNFIDVQYCKVYIEQNYYKLKFNLVFYISNNFFLPTNSITARVIAPTFDVDNIPLIKTNDKVNNSIENLQYDAITIYKSTFDIDISDDPFFQGTSNKSFNLNVSFDFNSDLINSDNSSIDQIVFENFLLELLNCTFNLKIYNTSYSEIDDMEIYNHIYAYESDNLNNSKTYYKRIKFSVENFTSVDYSIKKLFSFEILDEIQNITISNVKLKLNYNHEGVNKIAQLILESEADYSSNNLSFVLNNYETYFDKLKNEIVFQRGNRGIFFPFDTSGFYEVNFTLIINNKPIIYNIKNNYSYLYQINKANFVVENIFEELIDYEEMIYKE